MKHRLKWDEKIGILFLTAGIVMLGISVYLCFCSDIWYDELFTMGLGNQSLGNMVSITAGDVHPPLYYMIVSLFIKGAGGDPARQVIAAKLVSVLPFLLCILLAVTKIRKHFGLLCAGFFSFLLVSMPQLSQYTVEIRMYGYALLFITAAMLLAYEICAGDSGGSDGQRSGEIADAAKSREGGRRQRGRYVLLTICALAACYTHYFACVAAVMVYLFLLAVFLWKKKLKENFMPWLISGGVCAVGYLPWLLLVVREQVAKVSENYWIQPVSLRTLGGCIKFIFLPSFTNQTLNVVFTVLMVLIWLAVLGSCIRHGLALRSGRMAERGAAGENTRMTERRASAGNIRMTETAAVDENAGQSADAENRLLFAAGCIGVLGGVVAFGIAASLILRPIFVYRYMLPALGLFWLAFAVLLTGLKKKRELLIPVLLFFAVIGVRNFRAFYGEEMWKQVQMEQVWEAFGQIGEEDILLYNFDQPQGVVSFYLPNASYLWYGEPEALIRRMYPQNHALVEGEFSDEAGVEAIKQFLKEGKTLWYLGSGNVREEILEKWEQAGIAAEECSSVMLERYWFNIYRLGLQ